MTDPVGQMLTWIQNSADNQGLPFIVINKQSAHVFAYNDRGELVGSSAALLGKAIGDDSAPGIGKLALNKIREKDRTTPAGRFFASMGENLNGNGILWVDYENAISLHPIRSNSPSEQRKKRLSTPTSEDNRISFGCINVSMTFFNASVIPHFESKGGIVYVLPETRSLESVFGPMLVSEH